MGESDGEKNTLSQSGKLSLNKMQYLLMILKSHLPEKKKTKKECFPNTVGNVRKQKLMFNTNG